MNKPNAIWDARAVLSTLGSPSDVQSACRVWGLKAPAPAAVRMWKSRGRIPAHWMPTVLLLLAAQRKDPCTYIRRLTTG